MEDLFRTLYDYVSVVINVYQEQAQEQVVKSQARTIIKAHSIKSDEMTIKEGTHYT